MIPTDAAREPDVSVWWMGDDATPWREAFVQWISGTDSPRRLSSTWRIHAVGRDTRSLPRIASRWTGVQPVASSIVVWTIPKEGIADLLHRIDHVRHTRPGYIHLSAGLAAPVERRILGEVGIRAHVQHPRDWHNYAVVFRYSSSPAGRSSSSIAGSS